MRRTFTCIIMLLAFVLMATAQKGFMSGSSALLMADLQ